ALGIAGAGADERRALHDVVSRSGDYLARREAALALGMLHDDQVRGRLHEIAAGTRVPDIERASAVVSLGRVGHYTDTGLLVGLIDEQDTNDQLRACVVHALGLLLDRREGEPLGRVAANSRWFNTILGRWRWPPVWDVNHLVD